MREGERRDGGDFSQDFTNIVCDSEGNFTYAIMSQNEYTIMTHDRKGNTVRTIHRPYKPIAMKGARLEEHARNLQGRAGIDKKLGLTSSTANGVAPYYFAIEALALDSFDNLWVLTGEGRGRDALSVDLYDAKGNFRKSFSLENKELGSQKVRHVLVRDNYLYAIVGDKNEQNEHVYRYALPEEIWQ